MTTYFCCNNPVKAIWVNMTHVSGDSIYKIEIVTQVEIPVIINGAPEKRALNK